MKAWSAKPKTKIKKVQEKKNDKKKKIIIIASIIAVLIIGLIAFLLLHKTEKKETKEKSIKEAWGQTYYTYLKNINEKDKGEEAGLPDDMYDAKINFYQIKNIDDPVMAISYELKDKDYTNIYYIEDKKVIKRETKHPVFMLTP